MCGCRLSLDFFDPSANTPVNRFLIGAVYSVKEHGGEGAVNKSHSPIGSDE